MKIRVLFCCSALITVWQAWEMLVPVLPPNWPLMIGVRQLLVGSLVQPNRPGPSAPDGSVGQPPAVEVVCSLSWRSRDGEGRGLGGYGGGGAKTVPFCVAASHSHAEIVSARPLDASGGPQDAWAQA